MWYPHRLQSDHTESSLQCCQYGLSWLSLTYPGQPFSTKVKTCDKQGSCAVKYFTWCDVNGPSSSCCSNKMVLVQAELDHQDTDCLSTFITGTMRTANSACLIGIRMPSFTNLFPVVFQQVVSLHIELGMPYKILAIQWDWWECELWNP